MCGIAGYFSLSGKAGKEHLIKMSSAIAHRGPDAEGFFQEAKAGLAHRRLSIIDLSECANQPMVSASGRFVIAFNGEIYNYREVEKKYQLKLKTASDTEVLLEAFEKRGLAVLNDLNGMFAAAVYDREQEELFLFKDRVGKKPLYYFLKNNELCFSSELKALQALTHLGLSLNKEACQRFLHLGYIPAPLTIYNEVHKLEPGSFVKISSSETVKKRWYSVDEKIASKTALSEEEALKELQNLVESSVKYRMQSDVPFGTFLSGGIDSSLVTAVASKLSPQPVKTFSIGFKEKKFDESVHAAEIAKYLGTEHTTYTVSEKDALQSLEKVMDNFDEPFSDSSALPFNIVSALARQKVTMVLSGDGGDELFMGYGAYTWAQRLSNPLINTLGKVSYPFTRNFAPQKVKRVARMFENSASTESRIFSQEQYLFSEKELKSYLNFNLTSFNPDLPENKRLNSAEKQALFDLNYYLPDDLMVKTDRASMVNSMEVRSPLLDYRLVEFALNLPYELKVRKGESKYLLKKLLYEYVPETFFQRPKQGFSIPLQKWLQGDLRYLLEEFLNAEALNKSEIFNTKKVLQLKERFLKGENYLYNRIWALIVLQRFLSNKR